MEITPSKRLQVLSGSNKGTLAKSVAEHLNIKMGGVHLSRFANSEINCRLDESVRGADVFILQTHDKPVNESIMKQAIVIDAAKRASAKRITAVCPFFGYARQDRKSTGREPITAKLIVDILETAGADRIVAVDLHSGQIQGFFDGPFDHLTAMPVLLGYIRDNLNEDLVMVAPDAGRVKMAERYAGLLNAGLAIVHKRRVRHQANTVEALDVIGDVEGKNCILIDDMIDTAGTVCAASEQLKKHGAAHVYAMATHPVLSDPAIERLNSSAIDKVIITDTLPIHTTVATDKIEVLSVAPIIAEAISAIFHDRSVSQIFGGENQL
ncbi:MAG TPA: ribose-phosphate diphosphokinase [Candidatus Polarisedimenticolaceae bacterium]|nr:ribose-phosphate diphosphokinase [Candidatus Polarisedimenticolaceae bacterium]